MVFPEPQFRNKKTMVHVAQCDSDMGASTTVIDALKMYGFDDDYFNTDWVMVVVRNDNAVGVAPEGQIRDITDYSSVDGVFTTVAFGANVEALDVVMIARREIFVVDGVALQATPIADSFAYKVSQYLASGDGDFATGTVLPSDASLYDTLGVPQHFTATASTVNSLTCAGLIDQAGLYLGEIVVPLSGNMAGQGRYITAYDGTQTITVLPAWPADPGSIDFIVIPSEMGRILLALGAEYDGAPDLYDVLVTGYTTAATATAVGALLERVQLLQQALINNNTIFTSSAATVNTVTCAALVDRADLYEGMMLVPMTGNQAGQGRYITAYDGDDVLTVVPDWSTDPDAAGAFTFVVMPSPLKFAYEAGKGLSAIYDLVNGIPVLTRIYNDYNILVLTAEETIFEYDDAAYIWHPKWLIFHLDELAATEQLEVKVYEKDNDTDNNWRLMMHLDYLGVQAVPVKFVELPPVDLAFKVTVEQTGGVLRDVLFKLYKES